MGGLVMAFQSLNVSKGIFGSPFIGLKNFQFLFSTTDAFIITRNTGYRNFQQSWSMFGTVFSVLSTMTGLASTYFAIRAYLNSTNKD